VLLDAGPDEDRRSRLVFIVKDMAKEEVERTFEAFDYAPQLKTKTIDPAAYAQFVAAMQGFSNSGVATVARAPQEKSGGGAVAPAPREEDKSEIAGVPERGR
jgi:hypothetical protein